jgi:hypothetical protein
MNNNISQSNSKRLLKNERIFRRLTGLTPNKFRKLIDQLKPLFRELEEKRLNKKTRKRKIGGGNKNKLCLEDRLLLLLMYYRTYTTYAFLGFIFHIDESNVGRNFKPLEPLLAQIFKIPERKVKLGEDEILELFFDGSEQPTERPKRRQKKFYSGKKKTHTKKFQVLVVKKKKKPGLGKKPRKLRIAAISKVVSGKMHDKKLYEKERVQKPPGILGIGDTGYLGTTLKIPYKKPRKKELTRRQRKFNRKLSSNRVCVEHAIGKMKIWLISRNKIRNSKRNHSLTIKNIAGLHNLMFA